MPQCMGAHIVQSLHSGPGHRMVADAACLCSRALHPHVGHRCFLECLPVHNKLQQPWPQHTPHTPVWTHRPNQRVHFSIHSMQWAPVCRELHACVALDQGSPPLAYCTGTILDQRKNYDSNSCIPCTLYPSSTNRSLCYQQEDDPAGASYSRVGTPNMAYTAYKQYGRVKNPPRMWA